MKYVNHQPTPVFGSEGQPLMPCHPARARKLLANGRAVPHHVRGIFGIRLLDRSRAESAVQDVALDIDPGSGATGFAVVFDDGQGKRTVLAAVELRHRACAIKAALTRRRQLRGTRRGRLRHRAPRFDHRRRRPGALPPSVESLRTDTMRAAYALTRIYPVAAVSVERNKFDPQLMADPGIKGAEYQRGTLYGWQLRAYILERDGGRCVYCRRRNLRLELDHVRPRAVGSDRVGNLAACYRDCNLAKANRSVEEFLAGRPELLGRILEQLQRSNLTGAAHINAALPAIVGDLRKLGLPVTLADAASVSWARQWMNLPKTHCYDAALQGQNFTSVVSLPAQVLVLRPNNGRSKRKANVDRHGTPAGRPFREQQRLPKRLRRRNPAVGHSDPRQRHGPQLIATGDTVRIKGRTGRAVIKSAGTRTALHRSKPQLSAKIADCRLIARGLGYSIGRGKPSQQEHQAEGEKADGENVGT